MPEFRHWHATQRGGRGEKSPDSLQGSRKERGREKRVCNPGGISTYSIDRVLEKRRWMTSFGTIVTINPRRFAESDIPLSRRMSPKRKWSNPAFTRCLRHASHTPRTCCSGVPPTLNHEWRWSSPKSLHRTRPPEAGLITLPIK